MTFIKRGGPSSENVELGWRIVKLGVNERSDLEAFLDVVFI